LPSCGGPMDPEANMREQEEILAAKGRGEFFDLERLKELREAIRDGLKAGGYDLRPRSQRRRKG
jgi:hypothetical protein